MARVIQDSDDELDGEDEMCSPVRRVNGTGSTESLRRNIEAAHGALVAPTQSFHHTVDRDAIPMIKSTTCSPTIVNGDYVAYHPKMTGSEVVLEAPMESTLPATELLNGLWELPGSIREDFEHHQPLAMFPEMSSTVPNNTLTQQILMDEISRPNRVDGPITMPDLDRQNSSIPWSAYMTTPSDKKDATQGSARTRAESFNGDISRSSHSSNVPTNHNHQEESGSCSKMEEWPSQDSVVSLVKDRRSAKRRQLESVQSDIGNATIAALPPEKRRKTREVTSKKASSDDFHDDVAAIGIPKERYQPRPSRSRSTNVPVEDPIDYSKRPEKAKRSRAKRNITTGSIGQLALSSSEKAERICAMGFSPSNVNTALKECDGVFDQAVEWLLNRPDFTKVQSCTYSTENLTDQSEIVCENIKDDQGPEVTKDQLPRKENVRELLHVEIPARKSISKRKIDCLEEEKLSKARQDRDEVLESVSVGLAHKDTDEVALPAETKQAEATEEVAVVLNKMKRRKTLPLDEAKDEINRAVPLQPFEATKRGRGRPRRSEKTTEAPVVVSEEVETSTKDESQAMGDYEGNEGTTLQTDITSAGATMTEERPFPNTPPDEVVMDAALPSETIQRVVSKAQKPSKGSGALLSPSSNSKVPHRVGLSKRARIAPLLRVMKK